MDHTCDRVGERSRATATLSECSEPIYETHQRVAELLAADGRLDDDDIAPDDPSR